MSTDRDLLLRFLGGELDPAERARVASRLESDADFRIQLEKQRQLRDTLVRARSDSFAPYFSDRVMRRLAPARAALQGDAFYQSLRMVFARTALAGLVIAGALAAYNFASYGDLGVASSVTEALFGLPSASLMDALSYNAY